MKAWSGERKEIEKYNKSLQGRFPELEKELERLIGVEDEIGVLVSSRRSLEVIVSDFCEKELKRPRGTEPLKGIIDKLNKEKKLPSYVNTSMINLNSLSTYGAHPKTFNPRQVKTVLLELLTIIEWYISYLNIEVEGVVKGKPGKEQAAEEDEYIGKKIDQYKLLESVGEGGMGTVYMAEQTEPVKRKVALKIIKLGMDTREVVARFRAEQQALAVMDHPNIAKVYDAGSTHTGRPYFVMELIRGIPITTYCDNRKLTTKERLEIFISICQAIQHAHQKGIIHRDLKPSNILVAEEDDKPVVKIIDFGIAKAIDHRLTEQTLHTMQGQMIGTPEYMSPEQAERSGQDIDTRSDIFSLGVILYELVGGVLPFDPQTFQDTGLLEIQQILKEVEPPKVSTRISKLGDTQTSIADRRRTDPASLQNQLEGDLDWITMKAMSKDRTQRYGTATELAEDITRHLKNEPILACPPSTRYLLRKYIARHKVEVIAGAIVILAVIVGLIGTSVSMVKAKKAEKTALEAQELALEEARTAEEVSDFLVGLFEVSNPDQAKGDTITAREILDRGAEKIEDELADQPVIQTRLMTTMAFVYMGLGLNKESEVILKKALNIRRKFYGDNHIEVAHNITNIIQVYSLQGRYLEVEPLYKEAINVLESACEPDDPVLLTAYFEYGIVRRHMGDFDEAYSLFDNVIKQREASVGDNDSLVFKAYHQMGWLMHLTGRDEESLELYKKTKYLNERYYGKENAMLALILNDMSIVYGALNHPDTAELYLNQAIDIQKSILGPEHPLTGMFLNNLGVLHWQKGEFDLAQECWEETLEIREKNHGHNHPLVAGIIYNLALLAQRNSDYEKAEILYNEALSITNKVYGPDNINATSTMTELANLYFLLEKYQESSQLYDRVVEIKQKTFGTEHKDIAIAMYNAALFNRKLGEFNRSLEYFENSKSTWEKVEGPECSGVAYCLIEMATNYALLGNSSMAETSYMNSIKIFEKESLKDNKDVVYLEACYFAVSKKRDDALQYLRRSLELGYMNRFFEDDRLSSIYNDDDFKALATDFKNKHGL